MVNWCCRYYQHQETGFYYLQSRYYDPEICRFINADIFVTTDMSRLLSANMFSYCENNPVMGYDPNGEWIHIAVGAFIGAAISLGDYLIYNRDNVTPEGVLEAVVTGGIVGGLSASGVGGVIAASALAGCKTYSHSTGSRSERVVRTAITVTTTLAFGQAANSLGDSLNKPLETIVGGFFINIFTGLGADLFDRSMQTFVNSSSNSSQKNSTKNSTKSSGCTNPKTVNIACHCYL
ncbi:MAG: RHS repeat-associated core domain-containing protein [Bacillota bacterium]|nr:RHS repeat-associated core domain-containing protein [Bacillota bacterium]